MKFLPLAIVAAAILGSATYLKAKYGDFTPSVREVEPPTQPIVRFIECLPDTAGNHL